MTTEIHKHAEALPQMQAIEDFLEWCSGQGIELAKWKDSGKALLPLVESPREILHRYFQIDVRKLDQERRKLLEAIRG